MKKADYEIRCLQHEVTQAEIELQDLLEFKVVREERKGFKEVNKLLKKIAKK